MVWSPKVLLPSGFLGDLLIFALFVIAKVRLEWDLLLTEDTIDVIFWICPRVARKKASPAALMQKGTASSSSACSTFSDRSNKSVLLRQAGRVHSADMLSPTPPAIFIYLMSIAAHQTAAQSIVYRR